MGIEHNTNDLILQNLKDAGCDEEIVAHLLQLHQEKKINELLSILAKHRKNLLCSLHSLQAKLDCLDFLTHQLKTNK